MIFNTLKYQTNKRIKDSIHKNEEYNNIKWNPLEKNILLWSRHYKKYLVLQIILALLSVNSLILWKPYLKDSISIYIPNWQSVTQWQDTILSAQITIVAVIYPLVIGMVSVLIQGNHSKQHLFTIYREYSGFMFSGLSGIFLSGFIVLSFILKSVVTNSVYVTFSYVITVWFSYNLFLTGWFFKATTYNMLKKSELNALAFRYSIQLAYEIDLKDKIRTALLDYPLENGLLKNTKEAPFQFVSFIYESEDDDKKSITIKNRTQETLTDVNFWLLNLLIKLQNKIRTKKNNNKTEIWFRPTRSNSGSTKDLVLLDYFGAEFNNVIKPLLKIAFTYKKAKKNPEHNMDEMIFGFIGPALNAIKQGDSNELEQTIDELTKIHINFKNALINTNTRNNKDNNRWFEFERDSRGGQSYLHLFRRNYRKLTVELTNRANIEFSLYHELFRLHSELIINQKDLSDNELRHHLDDLIFIITSAFNKEIAPFELSSNSLKPQLKSILIEFIGIWERIAGPFNALQNYYDNNTLCLLYQSHLKKTAELIFSFIRINNEELILWGIDLLNNWHSNIFIELPEVNARVHWLTAAINHCNFSELHKAPKHDLLNGKEYNEHSAFNIAFNNAQIDIRIIMAAYILNSKNLNNSLAEKSITALLAMRTTHNKWNVTHQQHVIKNGGEILASRLRQFSFLKDERPYSSWIDEVRRSYEYAKNEERVSGRVYTKSYESTQHTEQLIVELAIYLSKTKWKIPDQIKKLLDSTYLKYPDKSKILSRLEEWLRIAQRISTSKLIQPSDIEHYKENFIESINEFIKHIKTQQTKELAQTPINKEKLDELSITAAQQIPKILKKYPLSLFATTDTKNKLHSRKTSFTELKRFPKESLTLYTDDNPTEDLKNDYVSGHILRDIQHEFLQKVLQLPQCQNHYVKTIAQVLEKIHDHSKSIKTPIAFIGRGEIRREFLYCNEINSEKKYPLKLNHAYNVDHNYTLENIPIYELNALSNDTCILISKESLQRLTIPEKQEDCANVEFIPSEQDPSIGELRINYTIKMEFKQESKIAVFKLKERIRRQANLSYSHT